MLTVQNVRASQGLVLGLVDVVLCFCEPVNGAQGGGLDNWVWMVIMSLSRSRWSNLSLYLSHREGGAFKVSWTQ